MKRWQSAILAVGLAATISLSAAACRSDSSSAGGLLINPAFERGANGRMAAWAFGQHAGDRSYSFAIDENILVITRVGPEPWGQVIQTIPASGLSGRTLEFSAEVSGEFSDESGAPISPTGIGVMVSGRRPDLPAALGDAILSTLHGEPELGVGDHDWTVQRVVFEVPEIATEIRLSFRLTLDGALRVRKPRLLDLTP